MNALHDGEIGVNVSCGQREHGGGGGLTPKKGIKHRERNGRFSTCTIALHDGESSINVSRQVRIAPSASSRKGVRSNESKSKSLASQTIGVESRAGAPLPEGDVDAYEGIGFLIALGDAQDAAIRLKAQ